MMNARREFVGCRQLRSGLLFLEPSQPIATVHAQFRVRLMLPTDSDMPPELELGGSQFEFIEIGSFLNSYAFRPIAGTPLCLSQRPNSRRHGLTWQVTIATGRRMNLSGYIGHATIFSWMFTIPCYLIVLGLGLVLGLDLTSGWYVVMHTYLYNFRLQFSRTGLTFCAADGNKVYSVQGLSFFVCVWTRKRRVWSGAYGDDNNRLTRLGI